jgi:TonB family protein
MKVCPQCHTQFDDNINFCLKDGTALAEPSQREVPTENYPGQLIDKESAEPQPTVGYTPPPTEIEEEQTIPRPAVAPDRPPAVKKKSGTIVLVLVAVGLLGLFIVVLGIASVLYFLVYRQPEVARTNSNSIVISNVNSTNADSNLSASNTNTNSTSSSNSVSPNGTNANTAANRKITPTPARTVDTRPTPSTQETPPPMPTPRSVPSTVSGGVLNGKAISLPKPAYPPAARAVRASGAVNVQVLIDEEGRVVSAHAISGNPLLIAAAEAAARSARFSPTLLSGQPVKVSGVISYNFVP